MVKVVRSFADVSAHREDLLQNVFVNLRSSIPSFRGDSKESTWVYRVSLQTAMVWRRGERVLKKHHSKYLNEIAVAAQSSANGSCHTNELIEQLYSEIRQLPKIDASLVQVQH